MDLPFNRHVLIGDEQDIPLLRLLLASFPAEAVGEVLLELPAAERTLLPNLPAPSGIGLRHLPRFEDEHPGLAACTALGAWIEEWVLDEHATAEGHTIFVGMAHNPLVEQWCEALVERHPRLHMHRPRHLGAPL